MRFRSWLPVLGYGALAAALLACLWLISLVPLRSQWGRELTGAAVAIVALVVGLRLAQRPEPARSIAPAPGVAEAPRADATVASLPSATALPDAAANDAGLSMREREVLGLLAEGLSNKELARALGVSENTIKTHLANLYAKLGVGKRTEALAAARRLGLDRSG